MTIFGNIKEIYEFHNQFSSSLEESIDGSSSASSTIGQIFLDNVLDHEFDIYETVASEYPQMVAALRTTLSLPSVREYLSKDGPALLHAYEYQLPEMLLGPIFHIFHYFDLIPVLITTTPPELAEDVTALQSALIGLKSLESSMNPDRMGFFPSRSSYLKFAKPNVSLQGGSRGCAFSFGVLF